MDHSDLAPKKIMFSQPLYMAVTYQLICLKDNIGISLLFIYILW